MSHAQGHIGRKQQSHNPNEASLTLEFVINPSAQCLRPSQPLSPHGGAWPWPRMSPQTPEEWNGLGRLAGLSGDCPATRRFSERYF